MDDVNWYYGTGVSWTLMICLDWGYTRIHEGRGGEGKGKKGYIPYSCLGRGVKGEVEELLYIFWQICPFSLIYILFNICGNSIFLYFYIKKKNLDLLKEKKKDGILLRAFTLEKYGDANAKSWSLIMRDYY